MNKKILFYMLFLVLALALSACNTAETLPETGGEGIELEFDSLPAAAQTAIQSLSDELAIPLDQIEIVQVEPMEWPDACLGLPASGEECAQVLTNGFLLVVRADGQEYEIHTDETGVNVRRR
jgi:hypothetical protein